jgi:lipopolysaccharide transport system ATP-binding protein
MSDLAIRVDKLGKLYDIGARETRYHMLREALTESLSAPFRKVSSLLGRDGSRPSPAGSYAASLLSPHSTAQSSSIWALKDVSFEVKEGEVIGVIGRNGAGKSTLLRILSRITEPTEGYAEVRGRVGAILEIETGFHPELTGAENIYLNGAILGMRKAEIKRRFDEIVAFAEVERFIDTPVKHYSSGMRVRLGFAVAAHLETEILLVDEVLAVGDAAFQKKCLGKMGSVATRGRTVLFISHNMQAISQLCPTTILLRDGHIVTKDSTAKVIEQYLSWDSNKSAEAVWAFEEAPGTNTAKLRSVKALNEKEETCFNMKMNKPIILKAEFWILRRARVEVSLHLYNQQGIRLFVTGNFHEPSWRGIEHEPGLYAASCTIPEHFLNEGIHFVTVLLHHDSTHEIDVHIPEVVSLNIVDPGDTRGDWVKKWKGAVRPILPWTGERIGNLP